LTGRAGVAAVTEDGSPAGERTIAQWEPGFLEGVGGEHGAPVRRSANSEAAEVMARVIDEGARNLSFVRCRRGAERVALAAAAPPGGVGRAEDAAQEAA